MKCQYSLTVIEPQADGELREIDVCHTESLKAICHEILRYKKGKECNELGQEVWETDYDFVGNDDFYVSTYCNGWRKFVRNLMKEQS